MKFVALVSGGKDSCFNILKCQVLGHELVALANLYPQNDQTDEIDSFMYQTVGYQAVSLFDQLFDVPLYRSPITGTSSNTLEYTVTSQDETEDLYNLLKTVLKHHPEVKAVSVGAILSTYQRVRVENVCGRLGLVSLAYLWQMPEKDLFYEIVHSGMDTRLIKTAAIGLSRKHLGKSLAELEPELLKLNQLYQLHMCGEGGEYETLVLDGPHFKRKLEIVEKDIIDHSNDDVSYLSLKVQVVEKSEEEKSISATQLKKFVKRRPLLDEPYQSIFAAVKDIELKVQSNKPRITPLSKITLNAGQQISQRYVFFYNMTGIGSTSADQVTSIFNNLDHKLRSHNLAFDRIAFVSLIVADMAGFALINNVYATYFKDPLPPARVCIEANLPQDCLVQMSVIVERKTSNFVSLHVQSQSFWAPANIGPYSQVKTCEDNTFLAGQIGLVPSTMLLAEGPWLQTCLSLQNLYKIIEVMKLDALAACVCYITDSELLPLVSRVWNELKKRSGGVTLAPKSLIVAEVNHLPRGAVVEWCGFGYKSFHSENYSDDDNDD
jgi:diphthine-ammonia ligase